jgi:HEAT repeat protein
MKDLLTDDRDLRQRIAEEAQLPPAPSSGPVVRAFQFFLVPLLIVGICVLVYVVFNTVVADPRTAADWVKDLREGGPATRPYAALQLTQALRRMEVPDRSLTPDLIKAYRSTSDEIPQDRELRRYLCQALGFLRDPAAADLMLEVVSVELGRGEGRKGLEIAGAAMDALGAIKEPRTLPALVKLLDDPEDLVRKYAAFNAGAVAERATGDARTAAVEALRKALHDRRADVGWNAAFALAYFLGDRSGVETLRKMLDRKHLSGLIPREDPNAQELEARAIVTAANAAAKLKDESFLPGLRALTDDRVERNAEVRFVAHQAIRAIQDQKLEK